MQTSTTAETIDTTDSDVHEPELQQRGCVQMAVRARLEALSARHRATDALDDAERARLSRIANGQSRWAEKCEAWAAEAAR